MKNNLSASVDVFARRARGGDDPRATVHRTGKNITLRCVGFPPIERSTDSGR